MKSVRTRWIVGSLLVVMTVALTGCGDGRTRESQTDTSASAAAVSVRNAGETVTVERPPQRIVSLYPSMTDLLIRLGVGNRIVGQAGTSYTPASADTAAVASRIPVLSDSEVDRETLLAARPDLIVADQEYHFSRTGLPSREELSRLGIPVYINQALWEPTKVQGTVEQSLGDITDLGRLVGSARAPALRTEVQRDLDAQRARVAGVPRVRVIEVTVFDRQVYAHAGGLYGDILTQAGATNLVRQDLMPPGDYQGQVPVETLATLAPDVIVYSYRTPAERPAVEAQLAQQFGATPAGRDRAFVGVAESATSGGRASVDGIRQLVDGFAPYRA